MDNIGKIYKTNEGYDVVIINKIKEKGQSKFIVKFLDSQGYEKVCKLQNIKKGQISNPYHKSVFGVGYLGINKYDSKIENKIIYRTWCNMLMRVYDKKQLLKTPTYNNVTVCDEWLDFSKFKEWYDKNYPLQIEGVKFELDKDLLQLESEFKIYSPKTCLFLPNKVNIFFANKQLNNTKGYTGVVYFKHLNKWSSQINEFGTGKRIHSKVTNSKENAGKDYIELRKEQSEKVKQYMRDLGIYSEDIINKVK